VQLAIVDAMWWATSCCTLLLRSWDLAEYIVNLDMDICMWLELGDQLTGNVHY
jgi:hypothetical protein